MNEIPNHVVRALFTVPVPEAAEVSAQLLESVIAASLEEAKQKQIVGREVTPFLLSRMTEASAGATLRANIALLENNARVAAEISVGLSEGS